MSHSVSFNLGLVTGPLTPFDVKKRSWFQTENRHIVADDVRAINASRELPPSDRLKFDQAFKGYVSELSCAESNKVLGSLKFCTKEQLQSDPLTPKADAYIRSQFSKLKEHAIRGQLNKFKSSAVITTERMELETFLTLLSESISKS
ncbi:MAG: hypothetical protein S4CHLAM7_11420 [Chlamydiae bacterium]|nr:hypothetical protein [Chlamydiota bacterium]